VANEHAKQERTKAKNGMTVVHVSERFGAVTDTGAALASQVSWTVYRRATTGARRPRHLNT